MDRNATRMMMGQSMRMEDNEIDDIIPVIEFNNMSHEFKDFAVKTAKDAISNNFRFKYLGSITDSNINIYKKLAKKCKALLETERAGTWNCIVGPDFGSYISYEKANLIFFRLNELYFLFFKFG